MRMIRSSRFKTTGALVLMGAAALLLASCNVGGAGIFYTLEKATAQSTAGIGDKPTVGSMTLVGTSPGGAFYVGAGTVYTSSASSLSWQSVTAPAKNAAGYSYICTSLTAVPGTGSLYAVYYDPTGTVSNLYTATVSTSAANTSPSWSVVSGPWGSDPVQEVYSVGSSVFAVVMESSPAAGAGPYDLYEISGPSISTPTKIPSLSGLQDPPSAGASYVNGTTSVTYWFIGGDNSGAQIYSGSSTTYTADPSTLTYTPMSGLPSLTTGQVYDSIYYSSTLGANGTVFASTSQVNNVPGGVYAYQPGGSWTSSSIITWPSGTTQTLLDGFGEYEGGTTDAVLVGAGTGGYYEIDVNPPSSFSTSTQYTLGQPGNTSGTITAGADYVSTTLASAHVIGFFSYVGSGTATSPQMIFALTQNGLWLNETSSTGQRTWTLQ